MVTVSFLIRLVITYVRNIHTIMIISFWTNRQGSHYWSPLSPNAKKRCFWHKNTSFGE